MDVDRNRPNDRLDIKTSHHVSAKALQLVEHFVVQKKKREKAEAGESWRPYQLRVSTAPKHASTDSGKMQSSMRATSPKHC